MITRGVAIILVFYAVSSSCFQQDITTKTWSTHNTNYILKPLLSSRKTKATIPCHYFPRPQNTLPSSAVISRSTTKSLLSPLFSSYSADNTISESKQRNHQATAVYALILASIVSFVIDNILHLKGCSNLYLYHKNWKWWQLLTSTFCHGSRSHLSGNLFLLLLFGRSVEDELGSLGLIFSYVFCGVAANLISLAWLPTNTISIGASGAVYGLFTVSVFSRLSDLLSWRKLIEVGVLGQFVVSRVLEEATTAATGGVAGINHVAHLAGASAGGAMVFLLRGLISRMERSVSKDN